MVMTKEKILVTGANGFLATNTIKELLESGYDVRGILRRKETFIGDVVPGLELIEGSFTDAAFVREAVKGCTFIVHIAAMTGQTGKYEDYHRVNVEATLQLAETGIEAGVRRMVYVSSANAFAYGSAEEPGDETKPTRSPFTESLYALSKAEAQTRLRQYCDRMEIVTVNPTFMIGPMDARPSSGRIITMGYGKRIMAAPPGGKNFVHVGDVSKGIKAALTKGRNGEAYLLSGENMDYHTFYSTLSRISGKKMSLIRVPEWLLTGIGCICSGLYKIGIKTDATLPNMKLLCIHNYYTNAKACEELGISFRPAEASIKDALDWFKEHGMLK